MSPSEELQACFKSGQMSAAEVQAHVAAGELSVAAVDTVSNERLDKIIYDIDAVMQGYDYDLATGVAVEVPPYTAECLVKMRAILRGLLAAS